MTSPDLVADAGGGATAEPALRELRQAVDGRTVELRQASAAAAAAALHVCAVSQAACEAAKRSRMQWSAWRATIAAMRAQRLAGGGRATLHACPRCESVCLSVATAGDAAPARDADAWIEPPAYVKQQLRGGWKAVSVAEALCPRCAPITEPLGAEPADQAPAMPAAVANILLTVLVDVGETADLIAARSPELDSATALDLAFDERVGRLGEILPPGELDALAVALRSLLRQLRGVDDEPTGRPQPARHTRGVEGASRFRPALRRR